MVQQSFGSLHTDEKLQKVTAYLERFTTALKNQKFELMYIDAFAGTGSIETSTNTLPLIDGADVQRFIEGSVKRALDVNPGFDKYMFIELSRAKALELRKLTGRYPTKAADILVGDVNEKIAEIIQKTNWSRTRAVAFLDPFGSQVSWETLERLARTNAVDVWYLFPSGLGVLRQIAKDGSIRAEHRPSLERMFGSCDWESSLVKRKPATDLFGDATEELVHRATANEITEFMQKRMGEIFAGGVNPASLALGSRNVHMYSLLFACSNPSDRASALAHRLAKAVLAGSRKRSKS